MTLTKNTDLPLLFSLEQHVAGYFRPLRLSILFIGFVVSMELSHLALLSMDTFCCFDRHQFAYARAIPRLSVDDIWNQRVNLIFFQHEILTDHNHYSGACRSRSTEPSLESGI